MGTSACSSKGDNSNNEQATSKKADQLEKKLDKADKDAKKQSTEQTNNKFVGNTFKTNKGIIKIEKLTKVTLKNATSDDDPNYHGDIQLSLMHHLLIKPKKALLQKTFSQII